jgi:D-alanine--D-alanine ligase
MTAQPMHIVVLMGGDSPERDVSLQSGAAVARALTEKGHRVEALDIASVAAVLDEPAVRAADVVFPALHGGEGEDGHLQALLDLLGVPYALSGQLASALAMDKCTTKRVMQGAGIPTPDWLQVLWNPDRAAGRSAGDGTPRRLTPEHVLQRAGDELGWPLVVKLNGAGSSVGVAIVESPGAFPEAFARIAATAVGRPANLLLEKYMPGRELTAAIFLGRRLPLLEIRPRDGFYDYANKYTAGASDYLVPAPVNSPLYEQISADALRLYELVGCRGAARVDFRLDGDAYACLEINTIPGMTATSLVPMAAAAVGIGFADLAEDLCLAALGEDAPTGP